MTHWSDWFSCACGFRTKSYTVDAFHRHNFPAMCRPARRKVQKRNDPSKSAETPVKQTEHQP